MLRCAQDVRSADAAQARDAAAPKPGEETVSNLIAMPPRGFYRTNAEIAEAVRECAAGFEAGDYGDIRTLVILTESSTGDLQRVVIGESCDRARLVGLLEFQKDAIFRDCQP